MKNKILDRVIDSRENYVHALCLSNVNELKYIIEAICDEFREDYNNRTYTIEDFVEFFETVEIYYTPFEDDYYNNDSDIEDLENFGNFLSEYISEYLF